ncbi:MAG: hypothetical protein WB777_25440 [Mycobacterium sp.]
MPSLVDLRLRLAASQATSATSRRRIARSLGAATGGLLGLAFLPLAVANADDYTIDPIGTETITGLYGTGFAGADTAPPAVAGSVQGTQTFAYTDTTTGATGTFTGEESTATDGFDETNSEVLVTSEGSGADAPPVGSVLDTYTFDDGEDENIYAAIPSATGGDTITDTLVTPYGDSTIPTTFDAATVTAADAGGVTVGNGDIIDPVGAQVVTAINGIPPLTMALQGTQTFDVDNASGTQIGTFDAVDTTTADGAGTYTEAALVTSNNGAAGDPGVGSIFNTIDFYGYENIYSDIVGSGGTDTITDTVVTPFGDFTIPETFDLTAAESAGTVDLGNGDTLVGTGTFASGTETLTGVNGLPPVDVGVQGTDTYDFDEGSTVAGTFTGDHTNSLDLFGDDTQTVLVTGDVTGDAPAAGSVIETVSLGTGFENVYSDIIGSGGVSTITDTLVTPFGNIDIPDASEFALVVPNLAGDVLGGP